MAEIVPSRDDNHRSSRALSPEEETEAEALRQEGYDELRALLDAASGVVIAEEDESDQGSHTGSGAARRNLYPRLIRSLAFLRCLFGYVWLRLRSLHSPCT